MNTNTDSAIDLSVRSRSSSESDQDTNHKTVNVPIVRPIPRPAWSIIWYQNLWSSFAHTNNTNTTGDCATTSTTTTQSSVSKSQETSEPYGRSLNSNNNNNENDSLSHCSDHEHQVRLPKKVWRKRSGGGGSDIQSFTCCSKISQESHPSNLHHHQYDTDICQRSPTTFEKDYEHDRSNGDESEDQEDHTHHSHHRKDCELGLDLDTDKLDAERAAARTMTTVMDVASCDGPVRFERISNPNFALTVEHQNVPSSSSNNNNLISSTSSQPTSCRTTVTSKTYICIYCNQSFKSLFCYQKHKKRHLNPVSVDITGSSNVNTPLLAAPESKSNKTKDLNVQFFPCKKCGSKFPSYYFVHKHKKTCH